LSVVGHFSFDSAVLEISRGSGWSTPARRANPRPVEGWPEASSSSPQLLALEQDL